MSAILSSRHPGGAYVIVVLDDRATVVVHPPAHEGPTLVDHPADVSTWAPDLVLLAVCEPPGHPGLPADPPTANISLVDTESFRLGVLVTVSPEVADRCFALVFAPPAAHVEVLDAGAVVALTASGLVLQVLAGVAAAGARDIDRELVELVDQPPGDDGAAHAPRDPG